MNTKHEGMVSMNVYETMRNDQDWWPWVDWSSILIVEIRYHLSRVVVVVARVARGGDDDDAVRWRFSAASSVSPTGVLLLFFYCYFNVLLVVRLPSLSASSAFHRWLHSLTITIRIQYTVEMSYNRGHNISMTFIFVYEGMESISRKISINDS